MTTLEHPGASDGATIREHVSMLQAAADALVERFRDDPAVRAIAAFGSFAAGTCDLHSDLDLHFVVHKEAGRDFFPRLRERLGELGPVTAQTVVPSSYSFRCVIVVYRSGMRIDAHVSFLEGLKLTSPPLVLLDREGVFADYQPASPRRDPAAVARLIESFLLALSDVARCLQRDEPFYATFRATQVVHMAAMLHRAVVDPDSVDYGMKHLDRSGLPGEVLERFSRALELLQPATAAAGALFLAELAEDAMRQLEPGLEGGINWEYFGLLRDQIAACGAPHAHHDDLAAVAAG
ncbi:MAG TPA: aminoglycoside 6-adenylyltransferase [Longimicrobium sp.]|nr:aminoglycoside 6-adenylyltransferase [Longimicrobium sp.]